MIGVNEFAEKIKAKHPEYAALDNAELAKRVIAKYPTYASQVEGFGPDTSTVGSRVSSVIGDAGRKVNSAITGTEEFAGQGNIRRGVEAVAATANAVPAVALAASPGIVRKGAEAVGNVAKGIFEKVTNFLGSTQIAQEFVTKHPKAARDLEEVLGVTSAGGEIAGDVLGVAGAAKVAAKAVEAAPRAAQAVQRGTEGLITRSQQVVTPTKAPADVAGEILQGKPKDIKPGMRALAEVDTAGVKTYAELNGKIDDAIGNLSREVDDVLGQDQTRTPLAELATKSATKGGTEVSRNFVSDALTHLKELYKTTADDVAAAEIDELLKRAGTEGLTKLEVNDISRLYGQEFGQKAFGKLGEPLTSVNAQMYENIRTGLKAKAREGIGGAAAQATDKAISALYNTRGLITKNVEAVQKLQQRIADRGLLEKFGHGVSKYADILTGGTIRGLIGGLLPRGAGYKTLNALDLEARLERNLKIITEAVQSGSEEAISRAVSALEAKPK